MNGAGTGSEAPARSTRQACYLQKSPISGGERSDAPQAPRKRRFLLWNRRVAQGDCRSRRVGHSPAAVPGVRTNRVSAGSGELALLAEWKGERAGRRRGRTSTAANAVSEERSRRTESSARGLPRCCRPSLWVPFRQAHTSRRRQYAELGSSRRLDFCSRGRSPQKYARGGI